MAGEIYLETLTYLSGEEGILDRLIFGTSLKSSLLKEQAF